MDECATLCLQDPNCETFSFNADFGGLCDLYGNTLAEGGFVANADGGVPFYDQACYVCEAIGAGGEVQRGRRGLSRRKSRGKA